MNGFLLGDHGYPEGNNEVADNTGYDLLCLLSPSTWRGGLRVALLQVKKQVQRYEDPLKILFKGSWFQSQAYATPKSSHYPILLPQDMTKLITKLNSGSPAGPVITFSSDVNQWMLIDWAEKWLGWRWESGVWRSGCVWGGMMV